MEPTPTPKSQTSAEFIYEFTPQSYLRIPGLRFDPIDQLIPYPHRAALEFLKPSRFKLDLPWEEYYDLLQPFDDVCFKLVDVLMYATDELRHNVPPRIKKVTAAVGKTDVANETQVVTKAKAVEVEYDWTAFFVRVLELLGPKGEEFGLCGKDVMWITMLYTRAYADSPAWLRKKDQGYYLKANIHYLHDLLGEWNMLVRQKGWKWEVIFFDVFVKAS
ncbi:NmrA family protein [Colletotrichum asianum]